MNRQAGGSVVRAWVLGVLAAVTVAMVALGWVVAQDFRQSTQAARNLFERFDDGLSLIDNMLFETGEVRRDLLLALHAPQPNRQLEYLDRSRAAEGRVRRQLESPAIFSTEASQSARQSVAAAWAQYLETRDEVIRLIVRGSVRDATVLEEGVGTERFNRVRTAIAALKTSIEADAQIEAEQARAERARTRLTAIAVMALALVGIGVYVVYRRAHLEVVLRVKTDFLTTMSHELRTPLTGVIGISELLQGAAIPPAEQELVRMLRTNAMTLLALVNNVLDYSRIDAGLMVLAPRRFPLHGPVEEALDSVAEIASRKGLALGYVIDPGVPDVVADEDRVRHVLLNLLSNAVKYTDAGEVAIRVGVRKMGGDAVTVTMKVGDTGIGIREEDQQRLLQWFSQTGPAGPHQQRGTGLGLAISDRLSRLMGGAMSVESQYGKGSTFTFEFKATAAPRDAADTSLRGARVLVLLAPGIVGDQVSSLLAEWDVESVAYDGSRSVPAGLDAVIVDGSADGGSLHSTVLSHRLAWGLADVPVVTIARMRPSGLRRYADREHVLTTPVRVQALRDTLCEATGRGQPSAEPARDARPAFEGSDLAVLIVEDNESNRRVIRLMLTELGLRPDEAASGRDAIGAAARRRYDLILMDVQMPDVDGLETTRQIRAEERDYRARIVALTANVLETDEARCRAAGMDGYLQKPLRLGAVRDAIAAASGSPLTQA
jgi:signal transduction histidine kinase/ActR/RegA family two-component response regulator